MEVSEFNKKIEYFENRIKKLKERIEREKVGPEVDTARKLLKGLEAKYQKLKKDRDAFIPEATSGNRVNSCSEEELIRNLGAIYWIFGPTYEETFSFKKYRIEFLKILPSYQDYGKCMMRVQVHIYEDNKPLIMKEAVLEFWKGWRDSAEVDDINITWNDRRTKYDNCHWFEKIAYTLATTWNDYFREVPLLMAKESGYIEAKN